MKLLIVRILFAFLGLCALVFAFEFAKAFSQQLLVSNISGLFFTSLIFCTTSVGASMVAFYAMRNAPKLKSKQRLAYVMAYVLMLLPAVVVTVALNQSLKDNISNMSP